MFVDIATKSPENGGQKLRHCNNNGDRILSNEVRRRDINSKSADEIERFAAKPKKKKGIRSTFNNVFRTLRSRADKLLTNFLSSGNYNRLIIATSTATAAVKRSSITDAEEDDDDEYNVASFHCGPQLTVSLGKYK